METYKNRSKRKQDESEEVFESSIFQILENDLQIGDLVWAKLNGFSWWPAFVYGCFSDNWKHVKFIAQPGLPTQKQYFVYCFGSHLKHAWVHQACLHRYKGLEDQSENRTEQAVAKRTEEPLRNKFQMQISDELKPLWNEALKEADEIFASPSYSRPAALEKIVRRLLTGSKHKISPPADQRSINEDQQSQVKNF